MPEELDILEIADSHLVLHLLAPGEPDVPRADTALAGASLPEGPEGAQYDGHDMLIAATAVALQATLVSGNLREFKRVKGLRLENWYEEAAG